MHQPVRTYRDFMSTRPSQDQKSDGRLTTDAKLRLAPPLCARPAEVTYCLSAFRLPMFRAIIACISATAQKPLHGAPHAQIDRRSGPGQIRRFEYASALHCHDHPAGCRNPGEHPLVISGASVDLPVVVGGTQFLL